MPSPTNSQDDALLMNLNFEFVRRLVDQPPAWAEKTLLKWDDAFPQEQKDFLSLHYWIESGSVNVHRVVGTNHWDYQGMTWLSVLMSGKRMKNNLQDLMDDPRYYLQSVIRQPSIYYNTVDGLNFYIGADGNHRTCLAKFFLGEQEKSQLHNVTINHYQVDTAFFRCYQQLKLIVQTMALKVDLNPEISSVGREDTAGWKMDRYQTHLIWKDFQSGRVLKLKHADAEQKLLDLYLEMNATPAWVSLLKKLLPWSRASSK